MNNQPTLEIDKLGYKHWFLNGEFHREDGPAIESADGTHKEWMIKGIEHRIDGPAVILENGYVEWYINGVYYSTKEKWFKALTPEQQYNYLWNLDE
jgi:hypothetical protein